MDALDRIEKELVKSPIRPDIVFQHEDLQSVCNELRAAREAVKASYYHRGADSWEGAMQYVTKKMQEARRATGP